MSADYAPGTVARATVRGLTDVRVMWDGVDWVGAKVGNRYEHEAADVTDIRPLVVLDLYEAPNGVGTMIRALRAGDHPAKWVADQIEAQTKPPKPAEPTGLGAVVEDTDGVKWVRNEYRTHPWHSNEHGVNTWEFIDVVRVLSEGVTA